MDEKKIDNVFIQYASNVLGDTSSGLSGRQIIKYCAKYAVEFNVSIPITSSDFGRFGSIVTSKQTALYKNLLAFNGEQQLYIIKELCELPHFEGKQSADKLKKILFEKYYMFSNDSFDLKTELFSEKDSLRIQNYTEPFMHGDLESKKQILLKYDEIYQMCLLAIMQLEYLERKKWVDELKDRIVNVK